MNYRRILIKAVFHFVHHKVTQNSVIWKHVSRCSINFLHELTCQISTNQSIKIGRKRDERVIMLGKIKSMKKLVELSSPRQERMIILSCLLSV